MKTITYHLLTCCCIGLLCSCGQQDVAILEAPTLEKSALNTTRSVKKKVAAEAYYYRTLISLVNGSITSTIVDDGDRNIGDVNLVMLYEANAPWAELLNNTNSKHITDAHLNELLLSHNLQIVKQFSIDHNNMGLVLESVDPMADPVEIARSLSMVEHVLMVNIKKIPTEDTFSTED